jgi:hypothetical protein
MQTDMKSDSDYGCKVSLILRNDQAITHEKTG